MSMAYSVDLRKKTIEYIEAGHTQRQASATFNINLGTINKWSQHFSTRPTAVWQECKPIISEGLCRRNRIEQLHLHLSIYTKINYLLKPMGTPIGFLHGKVTFYG